MVCVLFSNSLAMLSRPIPGCFIRRVVPVIRVSGPVVSRQCLPVGREGRFFRCRRYTRRQLRRRHAYRLLRLGLLRYRWHCWHRRQYCGVGRGAGRVRLHCTPSRRQRWRCSFGTGRRERRRRRLCRHARRVRDKRFFPRHFALRSVSRANTGVANTSTRGGLFCAPCNGGWACGEGGRRSEWARGKRRSGGSGRDDGGGGIVGGLLWSSRESRGRPACPR